MRVGERERVAIGEPLPQAVEHPQRVQEAGRRQLLAAGQHDLVEPAFADHRHRPGDRRAVRRPSSLLCHRPRAGVPGAGAHREIRRRIVEDPEFAVGPQHPGGESGQIGVRCDHEIGHGHGPLLRA